MLLTSYDLRGILKKDLTFEIIYQAVNQFFRKNKEKSLLLGVDCNQNNFIIKNFLEQNFPFEFIGVIPTPIFYYQVIKRKKPGIMITASHLPLRYSGLKFILENGEPWKPKLDLRSKKLDLRIKGLTSKNLDLRIRKEIYEDYFERLVEIIKPKQKIYVNFDKRNFFLNASLPYFQKLKIFHRDSSSIKIKSDLDNDRIFIYLENQKIHNDLIFYFLSLLPKYQNLGVPIFFSQKLKNLLLEKKKKIYHIQTGHYYFKKAFKKYKLDLAFEPTGHFYLFKNLKTEAPYLALAMFFRTISNGNLNKLINLNKELNLYRLSLSILPERKKNFLRNIVYFLKQKYVLKLKKFDGYLLVGQDFYLHLRSSQTENKLRFSFEGKKKFLTEIKKWFRKK